MSADFVNPVPVPADARTAAERLHTALTAAGFAVPGDFAMVRADVTISGVGHVTIGRLPVSTAQRLANALERDTTARLHGQVPQ